MSFTKNTLNLAETNCRTGAQHKQLESISLFCPESLSALPPSLLQTSTHPQNAAIATDPSELKSKKRKRAVSTSTSSGKRSQDTNHSMPGWTTRKPGRPRSIGSSTSTNLRTNSINDTTEDNKTKRPRGRPRKDEVAPSVTQNSEEEDVISANMETAINTIPDEPTFEYILQIERDLPIHQLIYHPSECPHEVITTSAFKTLSDEAIIFYEKIISDKTFFKSLLEPQQSYLELNLEMYQNCQNCLETIIESDPNNNTPINVQSFLNKEAIDKAFMLLPSDIV